MIRAPDQLSGLSRAEPFVVELERFHGPLDLLLHLIRAQDIDIFDIPIARITAQFQAVLEAGLERIELDRAGEFLELAATLVRIKAQLLLPRRGEEDWDEDPRAELVRRLLEYELFQEVAHILSNAEADRGRHLGKGYVPPRVPRENPQRLETTLDDLLEVAFAIPAPVPEPTHVAPVRVVTVEEKMSLVRRLLGRTERYPFTRLFRSWKDRSHVVAALLACLELAREGVLRIEQVTRFGSIWIFRRDPSRSDAPGSGESDSEAGTPEAAPGAVPPDAAAESEPAGLVPESERRGAAVAEGNE